MKDIRGNELMVGDEVVFSPFSSGDRVRHILEIHTISLVTDSGVSFEGEPPIPNHNVPELIALIPPIEEAI